VVPPTSAEHAAHHTRGHLTPQRQPGHGAHHARAGVRRARVHARLLAPDAVDGHHAALDLRLKFRLDFAASYFVNINNGGITKLQPFSLYSFSINRS